MSVKKTCEVPPVELDPDELESVVGGDKGFYAGWSGGLGLSYGQVYTVSWNGSSIIPSVNHYDQTGVGAVASAGVSAGGFVSDGHPDNFWTGASANASLGVGKTGVEGSVNGSGYSGGVSLGVGSPVQAYATNGTVHENQPATITGDQLPTDFHGLNLQEGYQNAIAQAQADHPFSMTEGAMAGNQYVQNANDYIQAQNGAIQAGVNAASVQNLEAIATAPHPEGTPQWPEAPPADHPPGDQDNHPPDDNHPTGDQDNHAPENHAPDDHPPDDHPAPDNHDPNTTDPQPTAGAGDQQHDDGGNQQQQFGNDFGDNNGGGGGDDGGGGSDFG